MRSAMSSTLPRDNVDLEHGAPGGGWVLQSEWSSALNPEHYACEASGHRPRRGIRRFSINAGGHLLGRAVLIPWGKYRPRDTPPADSAARGSKLRPMALEADPPRWWRPAALSLDLGDASARTARWDWDKKQKGRSVGLRQFRNTGGHNDLGSDRISARHA